ncbi:MAG: 4-(cytidine 5'-diphospho)-2-C-methyl-D-erythritol kinase [Pseudomonadota bacterium]|nr:4-(cytidine 5'-diphospho)-2-C-methyl-D-erythritol kinase [Pseudomonadota bacterium]
MSAEQGGWSVWPAPAKLNLFLRITGRRPDGYHDLQTVFRLLDWGDNVWVQVRKDGAIERPESSPADTLESPSVCNAVVAESNDLALKAAKLLQNSSNVAQGAEIVVDKKIPIGGGFGGGSSDAATALLVLNRLWNLNWPIDRLAELGLQLGADVPLFILGQNAWADGVGEQLTPLDLDPAWYVLADPGVHASTSELFQAPELTRDSPPATMSDFVCGAQLGNAFEPVLRRLEPPVEATFQALSQIGRPRLTGSGSGCFVEFGDRASAQAGLAALPRSLRAWIAAGASRSPLHVALETTS